MASRNKFWDFIEKPLNQMALSTIIVVIAALVSSKIVICIAGLLILVSIAREGWISGPDRYTRIAKFVFCCVLITASLGLIWYVASTFREQPQTSVTQVQQPQPQQSTRVPDPDRIHLVKWTLNAKKNIAYGIVDARDIKEFQNTYRLMLAVRTYRAEFDWQDDPWVEKSGLFTIGEDVMIQIPLSDSLKDRIVRYGPAVVFYYGAVPINVKVQDARTLKDIIDQGGVIKVGGSMGPFF